MSHPPVVQHSHTSAKQSATGDVMMWSRWDDVADQAAVLYEFSRGNAEAVLKATDIFARGLNMLRTAVVGSACMATEDVITETRMAISSRSMQQLVVFAADNVTFNIRCCLCRTCTLCRMATQLMEDTLFPLERRIMVAWDLLEPKGLKAGAH